MIAKHRNNLLFRQGFFFVLIIYFCTITDAQRRHPNEKLRPRGQSRTRDDGRIRFRHRKLVMEKMARDKVTSEMANSDDENSIQGRVVGGEQVKANKYTFFVTLEGGCGGSLIAPNMVLSAAHCYGDIDTVRVGHNKENRGGVTRRVSNICVHPNFSEKEFHNDFMILSLDRNVDVNGWQPIEMSNDSSTPASGQILTAMGFGSTEEGGQGSNTLMEVRVPVLSYDICQSQYFGVVQDDIQFCAGYLEGGKDTCQGDSGGPIVDLQGGSPLLLGVISFGTGCARPDKSGVYARVSSAYDWIQSTIDQINNGDTSNCHSRNANTVDTSETTVALEAGDDTYATMPAGDDTANDDVWVWFASGSTSESTNEGDDDVNDVSAWFSTPDNDATEEETVTNAPTSSPEGDDISAWFSSSSGSDDIYSWFNGG
jgi:trypsin